MFGRDMILPIKHRLDLEVIRQQKQKQINRDQTYKNKLRVDYEYKVRDKVILTYHTAYKYETPNKGPFVITQCFNNFTVNLQCGPTELGIIYVALSHINWILKLKVLIRKKYLRMSSYNCQLYIFVLNIKACNKMYKRMRTEAFDCNIILAVQ